MAVSTLGLYGAPVMRGNGSFAGKTVSVAEDFVVLGDVAIINPTLSGLAITNPTLSGTSITNPTLSDVSIQE